MKKFRIGIIGPMTSCLKIKEIVEERGINFDIKLFPAEKIEDVHLVAGNVEKECQGIIFTGIAIYSKFMSIKTLKIPHIYIPYLSTSILKAFWTLRERYPGIKNISIDAVNSKDMEDIVEEFEIRDLNLKILEYKVDRSEEEYLEFHEKFQRENGRAVSISGFAWVYEELNREGIKAVRLYATKNIIKSKLKELEYELKMEEEKEAKILVQLIEIKGEEKQHNPYRWLEVSSAVESSLVPYLKDIKGSIFNLGWNRYIIFSTLGAVNNNENIFLLKNILEDLKRKNIFINIGNGRGKTALESEINAKKALEYAQKYGDNCIFQVSNGMVVGPLLGVEEVDGELLEKDEELEKIAIKSNIELMYLKKIKMAREREMKEQFSSEDLAILLGITQRSATRIMKKLSDSRLGTLKVSEEYKGIGRPKQVIEIIF